MTDITATAVRWERGWEVRIDGETATQVASLDRAEQQIRDYLDTVDPHTDHGDWTVVVLPEIGGLGDEVAAARSATAHAASAAVEAAQQSRTIARRLRAAGYSVADTAVILGVSRGRVSQLANA